jgi:hypothetical protein
LLPHPTQLRPAHHYLGIFDLGTGPSGARAVQPRQFGFGDGQGGTQVGNLVLLPPNQPVALGQALGKPGTGRFNRSDVH